jgi:hypothetical protein
VVFSTNKTDCQDITEILLKVALNTINPNPSKNYFKEDNFLLPGRMPDRIEEFSVIRRNFNATKSKLINDICI